jgi:hypothetical protein
MVSDAGMLGGGRSEDGAPPAGATGYDPATGGGTGAPAPSGKTGVTAWAGPAGGTGGANTPCTDAPATGAAAGFWLRALTDTSDGERGALARSGVSYGADSCGETFWATATPDRTSALAVTINTSKPDQAGTCFEHERFFPWIGQTKNPTENQAGVLKTRANPARSHGWPDYAISCVHSIPQITKKCLRSSTFTTSRNDSAYRAPHHQIKII